MAVPNRRGIAPPLQSRTLRRPRRAVAQTQAFRIARSRPHGHVEAVLSTMRKLGVPNLLGSEPSPERNPCMAMIAARILFPGSKLAISRGLGPETLTSTLAQECALPDDVDENHLYAAMD